MSSRRALILKTLVILLLVLVGGVILATLKQLQSGWVWYSFLHHHHPSAEIIVKNNHLPDVLDSALQRVDLIPEDYSKSLATASQYGVVLTPEGVVKILVKTSIYKGEAVEEELQQRGLTTIRFGGLILGQHQAIDRQELINSIVLNIGKNYLSKKPLLVAQIPSTNTHQLPPLVAIVEPYQAGIKASIQINKKSLTAAEIDHIKGLTPLPKNNQNIAILRKEQIDLISPKAQDFMNRYLHKVLGFNNTQPDLVALFGIGSQVGLIQQNSDIALVAISRDSIKMASSLENYLNQEEAFDHPVNQSFLLPDGKVATEVVPNFTTRYFISPAEECQPIQGKNIQLIMCQKENRLVISNQPELAYRGEEVLANNTSDWELVIEKSLLSSLPEFEQWNRLSASQKGQEIVFFLEK